MSYVIIVTEPLSERALAVLAARGQVLQIDPADLPARIAEADALVVRTYTQVTEPLLAAAKRLKVVGRAGVALDNIDLAACRDRGIAVVHTPEANTLAVVDYTVGMIIEMNRRFWPLAGPLTAEQFHAARRQTFGRFLASMTLGIIGCGRIGSRVGRAAAALGMTVLYNDIKPVEVDYPARSVDKPAIYAESDIITVHTPLTDLTRKLINADVLAACKAGVQIINCARGAIVDYAALAEAIRGGRVSAAAVDCHDPEPPPPDYPMFHLGERQGRAILTPHIAARVPEAMERMCDVVYDVLAVLDGKPPKYPAEEK